ncbi:hypothetical protein QEN19_002932 [Hanseniaspora menglaensis]
MDSESLQQQIINITGKGASSHFPSANQQTDILSKDSNNNSFRVSEQKVQLDIDLYKQTITGITELWIVPNENVSFINEIQLDCQNGINVLQTQLIIKNKSEEITINDDADEILDMEFAHYNPVQENELDMDINTFQENVMFSGGNSIEEMSYLKNKKFEPKFDPFTTNKDVGDAKLYINMAPFNYKFAPNNNTNSSNQDVTNNNTYMTPLVINPPTLNSINTPLSRKDQNNQQLEPFTIRISYYIESPTNEGIHFVQTNHKLPIMSCYTTNNLVSASASNWVPCIDSINEKCLWEIEIVTLKDLHSHYVENAELKPLLSKYINEDISVITGDITTQNEIYLSQTNKRTVFTLLNPVTAAGVGFSIGFFKNYGFSNNVGDLAVNVWVPQNLKLAKESEIKSNETLIIDEEDIDAEGSNMDAAPLAEEEKLYNSFLTLPKTLEYFNNYFGTYPFNSLNIIVLNDFYVESLVFQGLCFLNYDDFIYSVDELDPLIETSIKIADLLSVQWFGLNITPALMADYWIILGIQGFMRLKFIHDILGNNEFQFRLKEYNDYIVENISNKPSLVNFHLYMSYPLRMDSYDNTLFEFIKIKAMMVLFILDCKMTKMERSLGVYKIINKLNILSVSGDLQNNCISNQFFQQQAEKTYKGKLNRFFTQWVFNSGIPMFEITQKFNKKKMVVEIIIRQVFEENEEERNLLKSQVKKLPELYKIPQNQQIYQGNMTIRIHEADGIPYEHIINISDEVTKIDIQYNSKYKKLKRGDHKGLGNILVTQSEQKTWDITPIIIFQQNNSVSQNVNSALLTNAPGDDDVIESGTEAYEWIRIDSDFEWIGKIINFNMKLEMYVSQLQLDKDVFAQLQSIDYLKKLILTQENFKKVEEMDLQISSCLIRCILDERYYYGVRLKSIETLSCYHLKNGFKGGFNHLLLVIENLLFDADGNLKHNNFGSFTNYQIIKALIDSLNRVVVSEDEIDDLENIDSLQKIKLLSQKLLLFNDNTRNAFNDENYICLLIENLVKLVIKFPSDIDYNNSSFKILTKFERLQKWSTGSSIKIKQTILWNKLLLINEGLNEQLFEVYDFVNEIYQLTLNDSVNLSMVSFAFKILLIIGIKNKDILKYFFVKMVIVYQNNPFLRNKMIDSFIEAVKYIILHNNKILLTAYNEDYEFLQKIYNPNLFNDLNKFLKFKDFEKFNESEPVASSIGTTTSNNIILGSISSNNNLNKNVFLDDEMKFTIQQNLNLISKGDENSLLEYSRTLFATFDPLKQILWFLLNKKSLLIDYQKLRLFEFLPLIYKQEKKFYVTLNLPSERSVSFQKEEVNYNDEGYCNKYIMKVVLQKESRFEKPKPVMKFSLNNSQFKIPKIKLKPGRKSKQLKQKDDEGFIIPIKLQTFVPDANVFYKTELKRFGSLPLTSVRINKKKKKITLSSLSQTNKFVSFSKINKHSLLVKIKIVKKEKSIS